MLGGLAAAVSVGMLAGIVRSVIHSGLTCSPVMFVRSYERTTSLIAQGSNQAFTQV